MTKKHFISLADTIREANQRSDGRPFPFSAETIAILGAWCETQNPHFIFGLWVAYVEGKCGFNGGKIK